MALFDNENVNLDVLKKRAFNYRWAEVDDGVIPLTAADPDFPVAKEIPETIINYVKDGYFSYTPKLGYPEFMEAASAYLKKYKNEEVDPQWILPLDSVARGMYVIAQAVLEPGDEAIVFDPVDYLFKNSVMSAKAVPVFFPTKSVNGHVDFSDLEKYVTPKTKMICLCNPHNPLGRVYTLEDLEIILSVAEKYDLYIMNDEIWSDINYGDKPFRSILELGAERNKKTISTYGFSKAFGVAGLRIGMVYCNSQEIFDKIVDASAVLTTAGGISSISQLVGITCLKDCRYWTEEFLRHLKSNRDYAVERINKMPHLHVEKPDATYVLWIDMHELNISNVEFTAFLKKEAKVALVEGSEKMFGNGATGYVRLCFATSREILEEGLNRLEYGVKLLEK